MKRLFAILLAAASFHAAAQSYPNKAVRVIVSFTPGSSTDIVGRIVMAKVSEYWGQPVVVENRGGAGGSIGSAVVAQAAPDGYTLLINSNAHSVNPAIYAKLPYDTTKDFVDIVPLAIQPNVLVVPENSPYKNLMDLVNAAKAKPGAINWGHAGIGSGTHLNTERFLAASGIKVTQIPFKGTPEVFGAMFSGDVNGYWAPISAGMSRDQEREAAAARGEHRQAQPDVARCADDRRGRREGRGRRRCGSACGARRECPPDLVNKINADVRRALPDPTVKERLANGGNETLDMSPQEFARFVRSEIDVYQQVIKDAGIKPQ